MKTGKPRQPKQPNPVSKDDTLVVVPDIEDLVSRRMQSMRDLKNFKKNNNSRSHCSGILDFRILYL